MLSLLARLGVVLYWLGCLLAIGLLVLGGMLLWGSKLPGGRVYRRGRCRVLAGMTGVLVRSGRQMIGLIWLRQNRHDLLPRCRGRPCAYERNTTIGPLGTRIPRGDLSGCVRPRRSTSWAPTHGRGRPWCLGRSGPFPRFTGAGLRSSACRRKRGASSAGVSGPAA